MNKENITRQKSRWQTREGEVLAWEVWNRLAANSSLANLGLGEYEGRVDLRGISVPKVSKEELSPFSAIIPENKREEQPVFRSWKLHRLKDYLKFVNVQWKGIDFSDSNLGHINLYDCKIEDCRFNNSDCKHWGVRASDVARTSFQGADLRHAVLGPWYQGRGSRYDVVDFSRADMRGLISTTATYTDCDFSYARLDKIDFQSSSFIRCRFAGEVREVIFYDRGFKSPKQESNPMESVDFSRAQLRWCAFRKLNLDRVLLPGDENHLILTHYRCVLEKSILELTDDQTLPARALRRVLGNYLKWIGPQQRIGIFNKADFLEAWGEEGQKFAIGLLRRVEQECSKISLN